MSETTTPILTRMDARQRAALRRFIAEERPDLSEGEAMRVLAAEALVGMGILGVSEEVSGRV